MTCIVGIVDKKNNKVLIGGDSAASSHVSVTLRIDTKVFSNGNFIFGCTSSYRMIQLLKYSFKPPKIKKKDIFEYMCTDFIEEVRNCFTKGGYMQKDERGDDCGGHFLVGYKDRLFHIEDDFQVGESCDFFEAIGCGANFALGSLYTTKDSIYSAKAKASIALSAAEYNSGAVRNPFIFVET